MVENGFRNEPTVQALPNEESEDSDVDSSDSDSDASIYEPEEAELGHQNREVQCEVRPRRQRQARYLPDSIPWGSLKL